MPSTFGGLVLFVAFLMPGFVFYVQRRRSQELKSESALIETARLVSVSIVTNLASIGLFSLFRYWQRALTPNPQWLVEQGTKYIDIRPGFILTWGVILLAVSCALAFGLAQIGRTRFPLRWFAPDLVNTSAWNQYLGDKGFVPRDTVPFVGLTLRDGVYVTGFVDWLSTELDEVPDRDLVLVEPIRMYIGTNDTGTKVQFSRMVVSARDIVRMYVAYYSYSATFGDASDALTETLMADASPSPSLSA